MLLLLRARAMLPDGNTGVALLALGMTQVVVWARLAFQVAGTRFAADLVASGAADRPVEDFTESAPASRTG